MVCIFEEKYVRRFINLSVVCRQRYLSKRNAHRICDRFFLNPRYSSASIAFAIGHTIIILA
jgi:hypothetical protein